MGGPQGGPGDPPVGLFRRYRRPKSSKYDTYRLRSRTSVVDENLFGEPLKNKLMSRSRSMEAISMEEDGLQQSPMQPQPTLFTRRRQPGPTKDDHGAAPRPERPRTALATMRPPAGAAGSVSRNIYPTKNKDFEPFEEGDGVFSTFCYKCAIL